MRADKPCTSVLVVEDGHHIGRLVCTYLEREGFEATIVSDGARALATTSRHRPSLIIMDVMLPNLDGWEICRRVRRDSEVPIILLTARGEELDRIRGFTLGVDDCVVRPFSPAELVERVKAILRRTRSLPEASLPSLFERFYRAEPSRSRAFGGAGIGLAVVKELIKAHGGRVDATCSDGRLHIRIELPASKGSFPLGSPVYFQCPVLPDKTPR